MYEYMHRLLAIPETQEPVRPLPSGRHRRCSTRAAACRQWARLFAQRARPARSAGWSRLTRRPRAPDGRHRAARERFSQRRRGRRPSAASPSASAAAARIGPRRLPRQLRGAGVDHLRRPRGPGPGRVDAGARAARRPWHARGLRPPRDRPQLGALHPRGDGGAQAGLRRPRAPLWRRRRVPGRAAGARVRRQRARADPPGPRRARGARRRRPAARERRRRAEWELARASAVAQGRGAVPIPTAPRTSRPSTATAT